MALQILGLLINTAALLPSEEMRLQPLPLHINSRYVVFWNALVGLTIALGALRWALGR